MMRRTLAALAAALVLAPVAAHASSGWARFDGDTWVRWHTKAVRPPVGEDVTPAFHVKLRAFLDARFTAVKAARADHRTWLAEMAALKAAQEAARRAQEALLASQHQEWPNGAQNGSQAPPARNEGGGGLRGMVCSFAWSCSIASCIVGRESGWNPRAVNPNSGAAGLMQELPWWWNGTRLWHYDPFNAYQNVYHGYLMYRRVGWSPWSGGQYSCS